MDLQVFNDPILFKTEVFPFLLQKEAENNLSIGLINQMVELNRHRNAVLATIYDEDQLIGVYIMTPPHPLISICEKDFEEKAHKRFITYARQENIDISGVVAEKNNANKFADLWSRRTGERAITKMRQRIYFLDSVVDIPVSEGEYLKAVSKDGDLVAKWILQFIDDTGVSPLTEDEAKQRAIEMIDNEESVYFWQVNGAPVSMARRARHTENGCSVNLVFTPVEYRKRGYGSSVVKTLSLQLLEQYDFCTLYTDLDYPTSNKIYQNIGYIPIADSIHLEFESEVVQP
ncbi:GNAT family N-acetyltransferase [Bacillus sp. 2205SS5-2]|uniref:GNAT family N-acetyltransferase n=1 Tax=Bacillus sp. 2205SS5-2 TaxID=3109031 RepID=UPI0030047B9F